MKSGTQTPDTRYSTIASTPLTLPVVALHRQVRPVLRYQYEPARRRSSCHHTVQRSCYDSTPGELIQIFAILTANPDLIYTPSAPNQV